MNKAIEDYLRQRQPTYASQIVQEALQYYQDKHIVEFIKVAEKENI